MMLGSRLTIGLLCLWICLGSGLAAAVEEIERHSESGPVRVDLVIRPAEPVIGDVVELELEVRAEAGVEVLMPEFGEALGRFEIVDFAPSRQQDDSGGSIARQTTDKVGRDLDRIDHLAESEAGMGVEPLKRDRHRIG